LQRLVLIAKGVGQRGLAQEAIVLVRRLQVAVQRILLLGCLLGLLLVDGGSSRPKRSTADGSD
jgi:hypothetical protein